MRESYFSDLSELSLQEVSVSVYVCIYAVFKVFLIRCMASIRETKESPMEEGFQDTKEVTHVAGVPLIGSSQGPTGIWVLDSLGTRELMQLSIARPQSSPTRTTPNSSLPSQPHGSQPQASQSTQQSGQPSGIRLAGSAR